MRRWNPKRLRPTRRQAIKALGAAGAGAVSTAAATPVAAASDWPSRHYDEVFLAGAIDDKWVGLSFNLDYRGGSWDDYESEWHHDFVVSMNGYAASYDPGYISDPKTRIHELLHGDDPRATTELYMTTRMMLQEERFTTEITNSTANSPAGIWVSNNPSDYGTWATDEPEGTNSEDTYDGWDLLLDGAIAAAGMYNPYIGAATAAAGILSSLAVDVGTDEKLSPGHYEQSYTSTGVGGVEHDQRITIAAKPNESHTVEFTEVLDAAGLGFKAGELDQQVTWTVDVGSAPYPSKLGSDTVRTASVQSHTP